MCSVNRVSTLALLLLALMFVLAGGAVLRESVTIDEVAHIGAGVSYLQKLDLRLQRRTSAAGQSSRRPPAGSARHPRRLFRHHLEREPGFLSRVPGPVDLRRIRSDALEPAGEHAGLGPSPHAAVDHRPRLGGIRLRAPPGRRLGRPPVPRRLRHDARVSGLRSFGIDRHSRHALLPFVSLGAGPVVGRRRIGRIHCCSLSRWPARSSRSSPRRFCSSSSEPWR